MSKLQIQELQASLDRRDERITELEKQDDRKDINIERKMKEISRLKSELKVARGKIEDLEGCIKQIQLIDMGLGNG